MEDIGKVNVSGPRRVGDFEFYDPRAAAEYMDMPKRLSNLEEMVEKILASITRDKNEGTSDESENRQYEI